jgi:hypothetical protein
VLGSSASGFLTTAQSSALVCLTGKSVNTLLATPLGKDLVSQLIFQSLHGTTVRCRQEKRDHGEHLRTQRRRPEEVHGAARVHQAAIPL